LSEINELRNDVLLGEQRFSNKLSEKKEKKRKKRKPNSKSWLTAGQQASGKLDVKRNIRNTKTFWQVGGCEPYLRNVTCKRKKRNIDNKVIEKKPDIEIGRKFKTDSRDKTGLAINIRLV